MKEGALILAEIYNDPGFKARIRQMIQNNALDEALNLTNQLPDNDSDYYFFQSWIFLEKGWYQRAKDYLQIAMNMNGNNPEYQALWRRMENPGQSYRAQSQQQGYSRSCNCCEIGSCLCCTDCCCESMGGDFISCC